MKRRKKNHFCECDGLLDRNKYRILAENAQDLIFIVNRRGIVEYVNKSAAGHLKKPAKKIIGKSVGEVFGKNFPKEAWKNLRKALVSKAVYYEDLFKFPVGDVWLGTRFVPLKKAGKVIGLLGFSRDITKRKLLEKQTEIFNEKTKNLSTIVDNTIEAIAMFDLGSAKLRYVNRAWEKLFGYKSREVVGKKESLIIPAVKNNPKLYAVIKKAVASKEHFSVEVSVKNKSGKLVPVQAIVTPIFDKAGKIITWFGDIHDISDRKKTEDLLRERETEYRELFQGSRNGVAVYRTANGKDFIFKDLNARGEAMEGVKTENIVGKNVKTVFPGIKKMGLLPVFERVWRSGKPQFLAAAPYQEGAQVYLRDNYVYKLPNGDIVSVYADVTEQKITEEKAKQHLIELEKFKSAVENASDQIIITDTDGYILYANKALENITGYTVQGVIGKNPGRLWGGRMDKSFYKKMWKTIKNNKSVFVGEVNNVRKNGTNYTAEIKVNPLVDKNGKIIFFVGIERDITKLKEIDRAKTEFVSLASHQLRTPLSIIRWYCEVLLKNKAGTLSEREKEYLEEIYRGNLRMIDLVNALLNVSRIESGSLLVKMAPINLVEISDDIIADLSLQIKEKKLNIIKKYSDNLSGIESDSQMIQMILQNLISNAVKYSHLRGKVEVSIERQKGNIVLAVVDNGYGIPLAQQDDIFVKLFRADNAKEIDPNGNGLGLYIAKSMVGMLGGRIWFKSRENEGSSFYVSLPVRVTKK